ncbi:MAG: YbaN family protein [Neptuniibacter sp.]
MSKQIIRTIYLLAGFISLTLGIIGAFLPVLPTTCFVLLAAFCFSKSSTTMHNYLRNHPVVGNAIRKWEENGEIPLRIKVLASVVMLITVSYPLFFITFDFIWKISIAASIACALIYIWSRPSGTTHYTSHKHI